ncbi:MAG: helix-turn-helix domain-containing protein [Phycisphaera sp.]|nr:helix-turn-helix domain-containing protein [Phycisphaera sp.]
MVGIAPIEPLAVDVTQAAALIGVSRSAFYKLVSAGRIGPRGVQLGKHVRYPLAELREWAAAGMPPRHEWAGRRDRLEDPE